MDCEKVGMLLNGELAENSPNGGNMKIIKFYACPECGNIMTAAVRLPLISGGELHYYCSEHGFMKVRL